MKQFQNKETQITIGDTVDEKPITRNAFYADLIKIVMQQVDAKGKTVAQMKKDFRIIDVIDKVIEEKSEIISLEDADFDLLKERVVGFVYGFMHRDLITFENDIQAAATEKKEE